MKLNYIYHSGFAIEAEGVTIIVDYYKDSSDEPADRQIVRDELLRRAGKLYVLSTHFHPDHFNPEILSWKTVRPDIRYIFSSDILKRRRADKESAFYLRKGEHYADETLRVDAFGSTDVGCSFLIRLQGVSLFHAGDLNNWHWSEESTEQEVRKANSDFLAEVSAIQAAAPEIDVVLFPVDSRMGKEYMKGAKQFIEQIKTAIFVPMHFGEDYAGGDAFRPLAEEVGCRFVTISHRGEQFDITKQQIAL